MQNVMTPLVAIYQTQLEASRRFADAVFSGTEQIDRVMIDATHRVVNEQLNLAEAVASVRDPVSAGATLQSNFFSGKRNHAADYQKEIVRIVAEMQNEIGRSWQDYIQQLRAQAANSAARPFEAAQTRANDTMFDPMKSMFSVWESAFKEVADLARKNMGAARYDGGAAAEKAMQAGAVHAEVAPGATQDNTADAAADLASNAPANAADSEGGADERKATSHSGSGGKKK